jgi:photosystem II stability/assembly factor-like uncharacterized protein
VVRTSDGGETWTKIEIPHLRRVGRMIVLSGRVIWVTDGDGDDLLFFHTTDGGRSWEEFRTMLPHEWTEVREVSFLDQDRGWLVLKHKHKDDEQLRVLSTVDSGKTWSPISTPPLRTNNWWADIVKFVSDKVGFLIVSEDEHHSKGFEGQSVLYTADGGANWRKFALPYSIDSCQALEGDLLCSGRSKSSRIGILTLHPK